MQISKDPTSGVLKIADTLHISMAEELRRALEEYLAEQSVLILDLSEVDACDTACLQLLYAARTTAMHQHKEFRVAALSGAVQDTARALGTPLEVLMSSVSDEASHMQGGQDGAE
jgi:anti-anti-sigma factor